jgi:hypothetical protein
LRRSLNGFDNGDIRAVVDRVAGEVLNELNYYKEAENAKIFEASLDFLGFVGARRQRRAASPLWWALGGP